MELQKLQTKHYINNIVFQKKCINKISRDRLSLVLLTCYLGFIYCLGSSPTSYGIDCLWKRAHNNGTVTKNSGARKITKLLTYAEELIAIFSFYPNIYSKIANTCYLPKFYSRPLTVIDKEKNKILTIFFQ